MKIYKEEHWQTATDMIKRKLVTMNYKVGQQLTYNMLKHNVPNMPKFKTALQDVVNEYLSKGYFVLDEKKDVLILTESGFGNLM